MEIKCKRHWFTDKSSIGEWFINSQLFCHSLEDVTRAEGVKIPKITAIPAGTYKVVIDFSQRFLRRMPHILDVPGFDGIRIHSGNTSSDTEGCIILGYQKGPDIVWDRKAFDDFFIKLDEALNNKEECSLTITNEQL